MGIDASASSLAPSPVTAEQHHKPSLKERIDKIFNKNQLPKQTLTELAAIDPNESVVINTPSEIKIDTSLEIPEEPTVADSQTETPPVDTAALQQKDAQQTAQEIKQVTQTIQQESTPKVETVIETTKTLFPDSPPLYEKHHLSYEKEKRTIKGAIIRSRDISLLCGHGKNRHDNRREVYHLYDCLRSRGLSREQILTKGTDKKLLLWQGETHYRDDYPFINKPFGFDISRLATGVERLDSLGRFDPNFLDSPKNFNKTIEDAVIISRDQHFEEHKNQLNQYIFLSKQNFIPFFDESSYYHSWNGHPFDALSSLQKEYFSNPENIAKFNAYLDKHAEVSKDLFSFVFNRTREGKKESVIPLMQTLVDSEINPGEKIKLSEECIQEDHRYMDEMWAYQNLDNRDQQRFLSVQMKNNPGENLINLYFDKNQRPKFLFYKEYISNLTPEIISTFSPEDQRFFSGISKLKELNESMIMSIFKSDIDRNLLFDENGQLTPYIFETLAQNGQGESIKSSLTPEIIANFSSENQKKWHITFALLSKINGYDKQNFICQNRESIFQRINLSPDPEEALRQYISAIEQINLSPSKEIQKIKDQLLLEVLNSPNPLESYQKISDIFIKNNLPMVGKIYRVFEVLYPQERIDQMLSQDKKLSRILGETKSSRLRQQIIFNDLLKANLGSGEQSLVNYLNLFQTSSHLLEKARLGDSLTPTESAQLTAFFRKLDTLYDASLLSRIQPTETLDTSTLQSKVAELYQKYKVAEDQTISDRVAQMYLSGLGIKSIPEALTYIRQTRESAHQRNLIRTDFTLGPGDLVKGVHSYNLGNILNFGCVAGEYLGSDAGSDFTPFDTDFIKSDSKHSSDHITSVGLTGFGDLFIIVKDRGQMQNTTIMEQSVYDSTKLEVFSSGGNINAHGIRTGLPSSEIDFLVATDTSPLILENMYYEIAKHGVYIPVLDKDGNKIFTPDDYFRYRHSFDGVKQFNGDPLQIETSPVGDHFRPQIDVLKKSLETESSDEVTQADTQVREKIKSILDSLDIKLKDQFETSILGSQFYNTGSSGRHTNLPGDFDFDYTLVLDVPSYSKSGEVTSEIIRQFSHQSQIAAAPSQIRLTGVTGVAPHPIDLDIGINTTADTLIFASHEAIEQKLEFIRQTYGQDTYHEVIANVLLAKQILKQNHAYKKGDAQDGGFGGIGTENWILANNGSIKKAFESFWQAAHEDGREISLDEFRKKYFILDSGQNLRETNRTHDNFIFALTDKGYHAMLTAIGKYIT